MNITKRLYTYPVLSEERDDYSSSIFDAKVQYRMNGVNNLFLEIDIKMDNQELQKLIARGDAEYVIHIECSNTAFRTTLHSITEQIDTNIPIGKINGKLEILVLIVACKNIKGLSINDWIDDYKGISFNISKASILAYKNVPSLDIIKNYEEFNSTSSIFKVYKRLTSEPKPMEVDLDSAQIGIGLSTQEYEIYSRFCKKVQFQPILNTMLVFPALVYVFAELKQENGIENNEGKSWFVSLTKAYEKRGIKLEEEVTSEEKTSIQLAQEAMELPLSSAFNMMVELFETEEEEEF